ncbi:bestrophin family ion channel [Paraflavitalea sp. CAU 1676]|uniref:bestrophin family protein n=1 Tax=Paraflavitalea sp. CAU 1676 TaxID=3032598 RepID=UPI0023DA2971|nr:bestrophin family ion channel [Paraflavitalea sp. CAU 1676]MDF2187928.1 bestrophin family ion channel [Paraflavitalea sp. CAU 1676]
MIVKKTLTLRFIYEFAGYHLWWLTAWMSLVAGICYFTHCKLSFPWLPLALIGTAVAFYVGFKNSHAYDRLWGGIKIWSALVNESRKLTTMIKHYRTEEMPADDGAAIRKQIIFRHIAYLYLLREQLLQPTPWEHVSPESRTSGPCNRRRRAKLNEQYAAELSEVAHQQYLTNEEQVSLLGYNNKAAQLLDKQTEMIQLLYERKAINMIQQIDLEATIKSTYELQGNAERIKQAPFPRKYASFSFLFVCIFIFFLPFGIIGEFSKLGNAGIWLSIPAGAIVGWVYVVMEMIGDYSENPFEGLHNDTPMLAICRAIEIDMLQMLGMPDIPQPIQPKGAVLL